MDDLDLAIHDTVKHFPGGGCALAGKLDIPAGTLLNKANPNQDAQLTLRESVPLQLVAKDYRILYAYSATLDHYPPVPFADHKATSNLDLINLITRFHADIGKSDQVLNQALGKKRLASSDAKRLRRSFLEAQQAAHELLMRVEALCDE